MDKHALRILEHIFSIVENDVHHIHIICKGRSYYAFTNISMQMNDS